MWGLLIGKESLNRINEKKILNVIRSIIFRKLQLSTENNKKKTEMDEFHK